MAEGIEQFCQLVYLTLKYFALVGIAHTDALRSLLDHFGRAHDVCSASDGFFFRYKWFVLDKLEVAAVVNQRVSGYARCLVIGFCKTTVY